jgi:hypothetical protein
MKEKYFNAAPTKCVGMDYEYTLAKLGSLKKLYSNNRVMCPTKGKHEYSFQNRGRYASLPLELLGNLTRDICKKIILLKYITYDLQSDFHLQSYHSPNNYLFVTCGYVVPCRRKACNYSFLYKLGPARSLSSIILLHRPQSPPL